MAGSTALGYYYYYVYSPPLVTAELFMDAMEVEDREALGELVLISVGLDSGTLRAPTRRRSTGCFTLDSSADEYWINGNARAMTGVIIT